MKNGKLFAAMLALAASMMFVGQPTVWAADEVDPPVRVESATPAPATNPPAPAPTEGKPAAPAPAPEAEKNPPAPAPAAAPEAAPKASDRAIRGTGRGKGTGVPLWKRPSYAGTPYSPRPKGAGWIPYETQGEWESRGWIKIGGGSKCTPSSRAVGGRSAGGTRMAPSHPARHRHHNHYRHHHHRNAVRDAFRGAANIGPSLMRAISIEVERQLVGIRRQIRVMAEAIDRINKSIIWLKGQNQERASETQALNERMRIAEAKLDLATPRVGEFKLPPKEAAPATTPPEGPKLGTPPSASTTAPEDGSEDEEGQPRQHHSWWAILFWLVVFAAIGEGLRQLWRSGASRTLKILATILAAILLLAIGAWLVTAIWDNAAIWLNTPR